MLSLRRITRSYRVQRAIGVSAAYYLRLVWQTTRLSIEPPDAIERIVKQVPIILAMWHGQHFLTPFIRPKDQRAKVLISRHRDGEINAVAVERARHRAPFAARARMAPDFSRQGRRVRLQRSWSARCEEGINVAMTADVPKVSRVAGLGIVKLAQMSGRPIYPVAIATRRRIVLDNWDRTTINLPFSRGAGVAGAPIHVPQDADDATLELARRAVEEALNAVTARAYEMVDGTAAR